MATPDDVRTDQELIALWERQRESARASYARNKDKRNAESRANRARNRERNIARCRAYYEKNKDAIRQRKLERRHLDPEARAIHNAGTRRWKKAHPDKVRAAAKRHLERARARKYGVTPEAFAAMLASQGQRCAICRSDRPGHRQGWHLDHDHATGSVRGILCASCNHCLGKFKDDPYVVMAAATYLLTHNARRKVG